MVHTCSARGCKNRPGQLSENGIEILFHRFPLEDSELLLKWFVAVRRKAWFPRKNSYLCSEHFTDDDYISAKKRHLKEGAVPTKFNYAEKYLFKGTKKVKKMVVESDIDIDASAEHKVTVDTQVVHAGGCHCGAVKFSAVASPYVKVHICSCSICQKKQIKGFIVPKENFKVLTGHDNLTLYTFNTLIARHYFCKTCGVQSFYVPRSNPNGISVMVYCVQSDTIKNVEEIPFDGKNWEESIKKEVPKFS